MKRFINGKTDFETWRRGKSDNGKTAAKKAVLSQIKNCSELTLADEIKLVSLVNISKLSGKLSGFWSVSTDVLKNPICQARAKIDGCICKDCYAAVGCSNYDGLEQALEINFDVLNGYLISEMAWGTLCIPTINGYSRLESHGDVASVTCARNYIRIIKSHSYINFTVWSKNSRIWSSAFKYEGKPSNMKFVLSSDKVNAVSDIPECILDYVDRVFTVYSKDYAESHNVNINCGARACATCMKCYSAVDEFQISELLK